MNSNSNNGQNGNGKGKSDELTQAGKNVATTTKNKSITPSLPTFSPPGTIGDPETIAHLVADDYLDINECHHCRFNLVSARQNRAGGRRSRTT
jgi:hypothetical protein